MEQSKPEELNKHLFATLDKLQSATEKQLPAEVERAKAVTSVAREVVSNMRLVLDVHLKSGDMVADVPRPKMLAEE